MQINKKVKISESLLVACDSPDTLTNDTMEELVRVLLINSRKLVKCHNKHQVLTNQIRQVETYETE